MDNIKQTDGWKCLEAISSQNNSLIEQTKRRIEQKYEGTGVEGNPYPYIFDMLADEIVKSTGYTSAIEFIESLPEDIGNAAYRVGLDYALMVRDQQINSNGK